MLFNLLYSHDSCHTSPVLFKHWSTVVLVFSRSDVFTFCNEDQEYQQSLISSFVSLSLMCVLYKGQLSQ